MKCVRNSRAALLNEREEREREFTRHSTRAERRKRAHVSSWVEEEEEEKKKKKKGSSS